MNKEILIAGFGGQGILFSGKFLAYEGLIDGKEVSWLPSYGPEMRGGTANCSIIISDNAVGSPIVSKPDILIAMNLPSLDKYENETKVGGQIFVDSSLIDRKVERADVETYYTTVLTQPWFPSQAALPRAVHSWLPTVQPGTTCPAFCSPTLSPA